MHSAHSKKETKTHKRLIIRSAAAVVLVLALSVSSFATVMANTVSANVVDGDQSYSFSMSNTELDAILAEAEKRGLTPLGTLDVAERVENTTTVNVRRGASMLVDISGKQSRLTAYKGDTVEQALAENNILLKEKDEVQPTRDTVITGDFSVTIKRFCTVNVVYGGKTKAVSLTGGTVEDAIKEAGVTPAAEDKINYDKAEPLFDKMNIRVVSPLKVKITADGKTTEVSASTETVEQLLKNAGITLSVDDRVNVDKKASVKDGMEIVVQRVTKKTVKETAEVPYETLNETSGDMYKDETLTKTAGVVGEKEVTFEETYVNGELEGRKSVSEKVIKEAVKEVVVTGTMDRPVEETPNTGSGSGSGGSTGGGYSPDTGSGNTFVDSSGNVVSYSRLLTGDCTAYSVPGGTTSIGWDAVYGVVAVDPNIIPYGTRLYITSPDGSVVYGYGIAADTGGAAMAGDIIADVCYNTIEECSIIGRRTMNVYVLD